jgi:hypothetical protein
MNPFEISDVVWKKCGRPKGTIQIWEKEENARNHITKIYLINMVVIIV